MFLRMALAMLLMVVPVGAQTPGSGNQPGQKGERVAESVPWLVTIVHELSVKDLIDQLRAQGYQVSTLNEEASASQFITNIASGLVIDAPGRILARLTNFRVMPKVHGITVLTTDGRRLKPQACEYDSATGYIVLEVPDLSVAPPSFAPAVSPVELGEDLRLLYKVPKGQWIEPGRAGKRAEYGSPPLSFQFMEGAIDVAPRRLEGVTNGDVVLTVSNRDAPDGGVILNRLGQVVGLTELMGPAKSVVKPIATLREMATRLVSRSRTHPGWLGVRLTELPGEEINRRFGPDAPHTASLVVQDVFPNSPAERADLKPNDYVRRFNGQTVRTLSELADRIARTPVGSEVTLEILRDNTRQEVTIRIGERPKVLPVIPARRVQGRAAPLRVDAARAGQAEAAREPASTPIDSLGRLGLVVEPLDNGMKRYFGMFGSRVGVLVREVNTAELAGRAGLRAGDLIERVDGIRVNNEHELLDLIRKGAETGKARLLVRRRRQLFQITLDFTKLH